MKPNLHQLLWCLTTIIQKNFLQIIYFSFDTLLKMIIFNHNCKCLYLNWIWIRLKIFHENFCAKIRWIKIPNIQFEVIFNPLNSINTWLKYFSRQETYSLSFSNSRKTLLFRLGWPFPMQKRIGRAAFILSLSAYST